MFQDPILHQDMGPNTGLRDLAQKCCPACLWLPWLCATSVPKVGQFWWLHMPDALLGAGGTPPWSLTVCTPCHEAWLVLLVLETLPTSRWKILSLVLEQVIKENLPSTAPLGRLSIPGNFLCLSPLLTP